MGYKCSNTEYINGSLYITKEDSDRLAAKYERDLPEDHMLDYLKPPADPNNLLHEIERPQWRGEGSGNGYPEVFLDILRHTRGSAEILMVWEGGDSYAGYKVVGGRVTQHEVVRVLGKEIK